MIKTFFAPISKLRNINQQPCRESAKVQEAPVSGCTLQLAHTLARCSTAEARKLVSYEISAKLKALPLACMKILGQDVLTVAVPNGASSDLKQSLFFVTNRQVRLIEVEAAPLPRAIFVAYHGDDRKLSDQVRKLAVEQEPALTQAKPDPRWAMSEPARFLTQLIDYAISQQASDIHLHPDESGTLIWLRIKGLLYKHEQAVCSLAVHRQLISRIKVLCSLDTATQAKPQEGAFVIPVQSHKVYLRISIFPTTFGEKAVMRLLGSCGLKTLDTLGLPQNVLAFLQNTLPVRDGAIIFVGATGSGKSTSLYAALDYLRQTNRNLVTIEDPVELNIPGIAQTSLDYKQGLSYPAALRAVLRQDPDVIMLGEIRDSESAETAFQAALTGHLILSTVHARNVFEAFMRLSTLNVDSFTLSQALRLVVAQRLLPALCRHCKVFDLKGSNQLGFEVYKAAGCPACEHSGYSGQVLAAEALLIDDTLRTELAQKNFAAQALLSKLNSGNYYALKDSLLDLLRAKQISIQEYE